MKLQLLTAVKEEALKTWTAEEWERWWIEPKYDGARAIYYKDKFLSRTGKPLHHLDHIVDELKGIDWMLDGEIYGESWNEVMSVARAGKSERTTKLQFAVFDGMPGSCWEGGACPYVLTYRRTCVNSLVCGLRHVHIVPHYPSKDYDGFVLRHRQHLSNGCDGTVLKLADSLYEFKRTKDWLKVKPVETYDGRITGVYPGEGKHEGRAGGVEFLPEGAAVQTRVGTGFSDRDRQALWDYPMAFVGKTIEVAARGVHKSGRLIEPRFIRIREDK